MPGIYKGPIRVLIPALNEEKSLPLVLDAIFNIKTDKQLDLEVIVADNGSADATSEVAASHGAKVVVELQKGYGAACLKAMQRLEISSGIVVFLDADFSDDPGDLIRLIEPIASDEKDFVLGSRTLGRSEKGALTPQQVFGNRLSTMLIGLFWRHRYSDLGPFRAISYPALLKLNMQDRNFGWTIEMQIRAIKAGLRISEIPVAYRKRIGKSKISGTVKGTFMAGTIIMKTIFRELISRKKYN